MKRYSDFRNWCKRNNKVVDSTSLGEYVKIYSHDQILIGLEPSLRKDVQKDINILSDLIDKHLVNLGVPQEDLYKNYTNIKRMFFNWLIGYNSIAYDNKIDDATLIDQYINISFNKGFYLYGNSGVGKTTFLDAVSLALDEFNKTNDKILIYSHREKKNFCNIKVRANQITRAYSIGGYIGVIMEGKIVDGGIDKFFQTIADKGRESADYIKSYNSVSQVDSSIGCYPCLYIDDFQWAHTASNTTNFGNAINVIEEVIKNRYDENMVTFATSNVKPQDMTDATKDRLRAQFNVIIFDRCESFRK